jgi:inner membrane protein YhjD
VLEQRVAAVLGRPHDRAVLLAAEGQAVRSRDSFEDRGTYMAAAVTHYAFLSMFPLLLVLTSALGFALRHHPHLRARIVDSTLGQFPVVGHDLRIGALRGSGPALAIGLVGATWAGTRCVVAAERAMADFWDVPPRDQPSFLRARLRALGVAALLGVGAIAAAPLGGLATAGGGLALVARIAAPFASISLNYLLFLVGYRLLTPRDVTWRMLRAGAALAAVAYEALQLLGGVYVHHVLERSSDAYGAFALVIGLVSWRYLVALATARQRPAQRGRAPRPGRAARGAPGRR